MEEDLAYVLEQIEREKGIPKEELLNMIESALTSAFRKHSGKKQNFEAHIDPSSGMIVAKVKKQVVEEVTNSQTQIALKNAIKIAPKSKLGDEIAIEVETGKFGRIAAQTAKQVIVQRIREKERENLYREFKEKEGLVVTGAVQRIVKNTVIMDVGKAEAILPEREQIRPGQYRVGQRMKVIVLNVEPRPKGPQIIVSRTHPGLVKRLFELEVPEVYDHTVEIKQIVREPGVRAKIAVISNNEKVDAVGACVGVKGARVQAIINELEGERMDLILWSEHPAKYIANSLSPVKVVSVQVLNDKDALVTVADDQLSLAIGKSGQNVRLAARLTGWHIDIKSESQRKEAKEAKVSAGLAELSSLPGIGEKTAETLYAAGYSTVEYLATAQVSDLASLTGIGQKLAQRILDSAKKAIKEKKIEVKKKNE